jgi:hypothetical protein
MRAQLSGSAADSWGVYRKLAVASREDAVRTARQLHLI